MYNMAKNVYECDFCGYEAAVDASDDVHGSMWECEDCGKHFCEKCFTDRLGRKAWQRMVYDGMIGTFDTERLFCPECYAEILRDYPEKDG